MVIGFHLFLIIFSSILEPFAYCRYFVKYKILKNKLNNMIISTYIYLLFQTGNLSGADSSDSCSDEEMNGNDQEPLSVFVTPDHEVFSAISPPSSPIEIKCSQRQPSPSSTSLSVGSKSSTPSTSQASMLSPLMYQTPQGMMYATPSNGGVLLSLAQGDPNTKPQFITIPLSMMSNGQGSELEITKRKSN